jgi:two-component system cell cycle sensor histidine kinase/response regulator CckA
MSIYTSIDKSTIKLLVIEDEKLLLNYVADYLEDTGYLVIKASNGREGLDLFRDQKPDMVITDLRMPGINGLEVMAFLRAEAPEIPIIVISGTGSLEDVIQTLKLGAWDYILKPIKDIVVVDMAIDRALERKKLIDENRRYREHLESEVDKRTKELIKSNQKFKTLFSHAGDAIFIHDTQGRILDANDKAYEILGYRRGDFIMTAMSEIYAPDEALLSQHYLDLLQKKKSLMYESAHRHRQGHLVPVEVNATILDVDGVPTIFALCRDISERKQAADERRRLEKQFLQSQKMESLGLLAGGIAHDFKNILGAIGGYAELLAKKITQDAKLSGYVENIHKAMQRGTELTDKLSSFTRKGGEEFTRVDLHKVLHDVVELLRPNFKTSTITLDCRASSHEIMGDHGLLENVFINLGLNARDAIREAGKITFRTEPAELSPDNSCDHKEVQSAYIKVSVIDTGSGMSQDTMVHLFEPFFTTKEPGKGTGLGLVSVYNCVKQHCGVIDVESAEGKGTTFKILFPIAKSGAADTRADSLTGVSIKNKILVIDDEKLVGLLAQQKLSDLGYSVMVRDRAMEAVEYFQAHHAAIGLVLIDFTMPLMNGEELRDALVSITSEVRIVYMAGDDHTVTPEALKKQGVAGWIQKPFNAEQFCMTIANAFST